MANCYLGKPLAFAYRQSIGSTIPREFFALLPALASGYVTVQSVPAGYMLRPAAPSDKGARRMGERYMGWKGRESLKLLAQLNDAMAVATTVGVLMTSKDRLPKGWDMDKLSEISASHFLTPGRETRGTRLIPVTPTGLSFSAEWATELGLNLRAPLYLARRKVSSNVSHFVLTTRKEGKPVGSWDGDAFKLGWKNLGPLKEGHSVQVRGIPGFGWVIRRSARSQLLGEHFEGAMPNLKKETVLGKQVRIGLCQRGSIPFCDVPEAILRAAGFVLGDLLAVKRLAEGCVRLTPSSDGAQRVRRCGKTRIGMGFRLGVKELAWCGASALSKMQFIACKGAVYVLRADVANDIPALPGPPRFESMMEVDLQDEELIAVPQKLLEVSKFKPGASFRVSVMANHTSIVLDERGPWKIAANEEGVAEIKLPRELVFQVESNRMRVNRVSQSRIKFEDARKAA